MKTRRIILHKDQLLYDVEALAHKFSEATGLEGKSKNIVAADHNIILDKRMLERMMDARHTQICKRLRFAIKAKEQAVSCNNPSDVEEYIYDLALNDAFNDNMLDVVKTSMHEYIVRGVLHDWYKRLGIQTTSVDSAELEDLERSITATLRTPSYLKVPLQPFGPK